MFVWKHQFFHFHGFKDCNSNQSSQIWMIGSVLDHWSTHQGIVALRCDPWWRGTAWHVISSVVRCLSCWEETPWEKNQFRQIESLHLPAITPTHARRSCFVGNFEEKHVQKRYGLDLSDTLVARIEAPRVLLNFVIEYVNSRCVCLGLCWWCILAFVSWSIGGSSGEFDSWRVTACHIFSD